MNIFILGLIFTVLLFLSIKFGVSTFNLRKKYSGIINIDETIDKRLKEMDSINTDIDNIKKEYKEKYQIYEKLNKTVDLLNDKVEMMEVGLYEPMFDFDASEAYKSALNQNYEKQKLLIKLGKAVICHSSWTTNGSKREGQKMTNKWIKLMLKAFNGECDSIIAKVKWNNVKKMKERINKAFQDINKYGEPHDTNIQRDFLKLKLEELALTYEYEQKKYEEKEEQKRIREQIREEEKLQKEIEKKQKEIEQQEKEKARIEKIRQEAYEKGQLDKARECDEKINELQIIIDNGNRRVSEAQKTKTGHVYVISNIGSFGDNVYKIGMTRRLEPQERIDELGSASVPFNFDIHAMIKSDNAPALENKLHEVFRNKSVNRVNYRKEFFRVSLEEIENVVRDFTDSDIEFIKIAEAKEYNETQAILNLENNKPTERITLQDEIPISI